MTARSDESAIENPPPPRPVFGERGAGGEGLNRLEDRPFHAGHVHCDSISLERVGWALLPVRTYNDWTGKSAHPTIRGTGNRVLASLAMLFVSFSNALCDEPSMKSMKKMKPRDKMDAASESVLDNRSSQFDSTPSIRPNRPKSEHWSFQPIGNPSPPSVRNESWCKNELDRFILAKLEHADLKPNPDADRYTLLRRVAFDLTGLPPTDEEIRNFVNDKTSIDKALTRVVDRYLDSPRFGERWGRHWLDIVRYADSVGRTWNAPFTYAWRYRDYVIDSFNNDKPYDQFITEQLAGDLMDGKDLQIRREQSIATTFLALGSIEIMEPEGESLMMDRVDEQIDVTTRALLGMTVSCARCHDHKYEPITMHDYYALAGIFYSTQTMSGQRRGNYVDDQWMIVLPSEEGRTTPIPGIHSMADITNEQRSRGYQEVRYTTDPNLAMGAIEGTVQDCPIRVDGEAYKPGAVPSRGDFQLGEILGPRNIPKDTSGRMQLARWLSTTDNPLTARVMVNRIWQHLWGQGLVHSVDDFGTTGEAPTHPELLDHLATQFRSSWSIKSMIRSMVLSHAYRLSSAAQPTAFKTDPQNELYWRMNARRLEMEVVRDAMLVAAGQLSFQRPEGIPMAGIGGKGRWGETRSLLGLHEPYRTVYLPVLRSLLPEMYSTFDFPNPAQIQGRRDVTTVAPQALFLMNNELANDCAEAAAIRLMKDSNANVPDGIRLAYLRLFSRLPDSIEIKASMQLLNSLNPPASEKNPNVYRWSVLIQALMISGEFRLLM